MWFWRPSTETTSKATGSPCWISVWPVCSNVVEKSVTKKSQRFTYPPEQERATSKFRPVDKLCPGKRLCRMEWERARKKTPFGVRRKLVSSFLSLMRLRKGGSGLPLPLFLAGKAWPNCSPIFALQMFLRSRSAVCAALFGTAGFPIHQYPPGSLSKNNCALCAWCGISQCTPSSPGRYRNPPFSNSKPTAALRTTE